MDYWKINQGWIANVKSHLSVLNNSSYSKPNQAFFQYKLTVIPTEAFQGFVQVKRKEQYSTSDLFNLKKAT